MSVIVTAFGREQSSKEWAQEYGINESTIIQRIHRGWSPEEAVSKPTHVQQDAGWRDEWTLVLRGAAEHDEYADETAESLGWTVHQVNHRRLEAKKFLKARTLAGAVWKAKELGYL